MKKIIIGIIAVAVLATGAIFVIAQKAGGKGHGGFGSPGGHHIAGLMLRGLDLTDEQKGKVKEIMGSAKTGIEPLTTQLKENHAKLAALGTDGKFDQAQVEALASEQAGIMGKMIVEKERVKAAVFAILSDEQKAKAAEMRQNHGERFRNHKGFGRGKGGPADL